VLPDCVVEIADHYGVPVELIRAVAEVEGGTSGIRNGPRHNGTYDLAEMQINTWWFDEKTNHLYLQQFGIAEKDVLQNTCTNIAVGTWILRMNYHWYGDDWYNAVAAYNAGSKLSIGYRYADKVFTLYNGFILNQQNQTEVSYVSKY